MMSSNLAPRLLASCVLTLASALAGAQTFIGGPQITASTTLPSTLGFTIDQIVDGITVDAPFNGFASTASAGTITLDLDRAYTLGGFVLWNDINVFQEGIANFRLDFFNTALTLQGSSPVFLGPKGQLAPATYNFAQQNDVARVNLVILGSNFSSLGINRIEIREVGLLTPVPEPSQWALFGVGLVGLTGLFMGRGGVPRASHALFPPAAEGSAAA